MDFLEARTSVLKAFRSVLRGLIEKWKLKVFRGAFKCFYEVENEVNLKYISRFKINPERSRSRGMER